MSIDRINISNRGIDRAQQTQGPEQVRNAEQGRSGAAQDSISLSSKARQIDRLTGQLEQSRMERFDEVRNALANGTYRVSGEDIAQALIKSNRK